MSTSQLRDTIYNKLVDSMNEKEVNKNNKKLCEFYDLLSSQYQLMLNAIDKVIILEKK